MISVKYIESAWMIVDGLTKALQNNNFSCSIVWWGKVGRSLEIT